MQFAKTLIAILLSASIVIGSQSASEDVEQRQRGLIEEFQSLEIGPKGDPIIGWKDSWKFTFQPGPFPKIDWKQPCIVESLYGPIPLHTRWFDSQLNEVTSAKKPGRYAAYIEGTTRKGRKIRRAMTFYCSEPGWGWQPWHAVPTINVPYMQSKMFDEVVWAEQKEYISDITGKHFVHMLESREQGAALLAGLAESKPLGREATQLDWPSTLDMDYHVALKRKLLGVENEYPQLKLPRKKEGLPAPVLRVGTPQEAGMKPDAAQKIREVCQQWYEASNEPFAILVARHGVIVIHEAFGGTEHRSVDINTRFPLASTTKAWTGLMFAQFIDQGLIDPDDPVGKFLPDFATQGDKAITLRHCLTHTSGLEGHGKWGGLNNPCLDNVIAQGQDLFEPGRVMKYNGMGFDLAGKVMEIVSGKSIFRLMQENFLIPLGIKNGVVKDLGYGISCTVEDLARIGQLMCNRGSYGQTEFFSPETFEKLMPGPLDRYYPDIKVEKRWDYGLGIYWMRHAYSVSGLNDCPEDEWVLGKNTIGHGGICGEILRVDLDNELVVTQVRYHIGKDYQAYLPRFLYAIEAGMEK